MNEKRRQQMKDYYWRNREKIRARQKAYVKENLMERKISRILGISIPEARVTVQGSSPPAARDMDRFSSPLRS